MKRSATFCLLALFCAATAVAQEAAPTPTREELPPVFGDISPAPPPSSDVVLPTSPPAKRGWFGRVLHPFSGGDAPPAVALRTRDPKLRGLVLVLQVSPQTVKLSEVRQLEVKLVVTNKGKRAVTLDFLNDQRIDIYLMNSGEIALTKWSDNHAIKEKPGTLLINQQEHVEYNEKISTRELTPDKVFIAEAFFPKYPELRARQKFLTAP
ncbi:MAG: BsuPI-related putative proteinase inhibitor [Spartobacteria bacterium]